LDSTDSHQATIVDAKQLTEKIRIEIPVLDIANFQIIACIKERKKR